MSVTETLLRILVRFPKLLVAFAKRCSSTVLHLLRYLHSLCQNASDRKWERKHLLEDNANNNSPSKSPSIAGEKAGTSDKSTTALCSEHESSALGRESDVRTRADILSVEGRIPNLNIMQCAVPSSGNLPACCDVAIAKGLGPHLQCCKPPLAKKPFTLESLSGLVYMLMLLDHPGFVQRSVKDTQCHRHTDINKWKTFCETFQKDVENINLLATVLLSGNVSFLSIITNNGLSYWPQKLSYVSLLAALGSILMGLAVRTPRFFTAHSSGYFKIMVLVLGFPFELFLYSIILFIAALIVHFSINAAKLEIIAAIIIMGLVILCLFLYWLVTVPLEGRQAPSEGRACEGQA